MDALPLMFAIALSLHTCATQPWERSNSMSGSSSSTFKSMVPRNEDGDYRFVMPEASTQKQAGLTPFNGGRVGVTQIESTPNGANLYARKDQIFRQNLLKNLQRTFKQTGNSGAYGPDAEYYPLITDLQRSRSEFERRKQMALNRFRNAGNNLSNGSKRDQGRVGTLNTRAVSFTNQNSLPERQVAQLPNISHTGSWTERQLSPSNSSPYAASKQTTGAKATKGQEQENEHQEFEQPGAPSIRSGAGTPSSSVGGSSHAKSGQTAKAISTNGQEEEAEHQASEYSGTASSPSLAGKPPSVIKANFPVLPKQRPQVTPTKIQEQEVERYKSGSPSLTPLQRSVKTSIKVVPTLSPPRQHQRATTMSTTYESPRKSQVSNSIGTGWSTSNESFQNNVRGSTPGTMHQKQTNENNHFISHHDYHYERVERMDRTLRILSRLGLSHIIPFITFQFMHNHPYALPLPHFPFLIDPEYFVHTDNSD
ncbi:hypothetical protein CHS0354_014517 [Potamilus streckersoni]|uniref:Uncharacterized protein n=1 Tax=Potamilus streckersoni TaxID=2493646 RepID=A0AAE0S9V2_9BIVA|nr:hypothetical protein CHS0354_014517 [Potamilus streckersoni]